ncbi:hypothetical protein [Bacillus sp. MRMR6]|uniref:hypothetical protein n=1 Tax=Bacillus sp. MRMR6 TaxID=1928617 RepID=UPI0009535943|nr:hypothetical protein [Bacillus sp. MRMR6]OLS33974.1 hypothetical protein BTR25_23525 [Bacillus sp. MRMR6]
MMKRLQLTLLLIFSLVLLTACGGNDETKNNPEPAKEDTVATEDKDNGQDAAEEEPQEQVTEQISVDAGLGDTVAAFEEQYGENEGSALMGRFEGDYLLPMFIKNRAVDLTVQFEATDQKSRTLEEAKQIALQLIPKDAQLKKEYTDTTDLPKTIMVYHSENLAKVFPDWEPAGKFLIIFSAHEGNANDIFAITIGLGETP